MAASNRPGRRQRIAFDATPINSASPDIDARVGWLLATARLYGDRDAYHDGQRFTAALQQAGVDVSRSLVSRWESGEIPVSFEAMSGYENLLGLVPGQLSSITGYVRAALPGVKARVTSPRLQPGSPSFDDRLDELIVKVEERSGDARDWQELGWHLAVASHVYLPPRTWESLAAQVVNLMPRGVKVVYRQFATAAMNISSVPRSHEFLVEAIREYLSMPDAQVLLNPMGMLDQLPTRSAAKLVLDLVERPPTPASYRLAVWLAAQKVRHRTFTAEERARLGVLVLARWRANPATAAGDLAELVAVLPEGLRATLTHAEQQAGRSRLGYVVQHGESVPASRAEAMAVGLAEAARRASPEAPPHGEDRMLARLIREGLFHRDSERRHLAGLLLSASPFASGLTAQLLNLLAGEQGADIVRVRAATLVRYLGDPGHRMRMLPLLADPNEEVAVAIAQAIGHLPFAATSDQVLRASLGSERTTRHTARVYALGMTGSPGLVALVGSSTTPGWLRGAAQWWMDLGPGIFS
ncbi:MAG: hypothetical protein ACRDPI_06745 [Nocardioidaceae bacterium]